MPDDQPSDLESRSRAAHASSVGHSNLPVSEEKFLDHVGHFVADHEAAEGALRQAGFLPTLYSVQVAPTGPNGESEPTGTGNICAMLRQGYIEVLSQTANTPVGREFAKALSRRAGLHLVAFAVAHAEQEHSRLATSGFPMRPIVHMRRPVTTASGPSEARFTVARVQEGAMAEGRIQTLTHHTEAEVWQPRWLAHPNGALGLTGVLIVSPAPGEAAERFARFLGRPVRHFGAASYGVSLERGHVALCNADRAENLFGQAIEIDLPWIAAYSLQVDDLKHIRSLLETAHLDFAATPAGLLMPFPPALGRGFWYFTEERSGEIWHG